MPALLKRYHTNLPICKASDGRPTRYIARYGLTKANFALSSCCLESAAAAVKR